ncbi:MAG: glycosyltransferase [Burkholderiaceae bacterium]|nr:glycosyltransferase [Burkholderiaceae bacterium]
MSIRRPLRILFFAEGVTLAHVARPMSIAQRLDPQQFDSTIACHPRYSRFLSDSLWKNEALNTIESAQFLDALSRGRPVYDLQTLRDYVREDLALIDRIQPDVVVGDFRLSLSVSARLARVPYLTVTNAYWSPYYAHRSFPLPVLPMTRVLPIAVAKLMFDAAQPLAFPMHCGPLNRLRRENGLPSLGSDLRRVYTDADVTLYADDPELFPLIDAPEHHRFLGPVLWEPTMPVPACWGDVPDDRPMIYVTLGTSGPPGLLMQVLDALSDLRVAVMASAAGTAIAQHRRGNAFIEPYLPGTATAARSACVICNGGSLTSYQALISGVPVLGIASNMDQFMNMEGLVRAGVGKCLRADRISKRGVGRDALSLVEQHGTSDRARELATNLSQSGMGQAFERAVLEVAGISD